MGQIVRMIKLEFKKDGIFSMFAKLSKVCESLADNKTYTVEIKEYHKKRSLNANAFMWEIATQTADVMNITKEEIYRNAVKAVGIYKDFHNMTQAEAETLKVAWGKLGIGWIAEQVDFEPDGEHVVIRCYYGSSTYNTKQMKRLTDYIVQDAKAVGIVVDDEQMISLLNDWSDKR